MVGRLALVRAAPLQGWQVALVPPQVLGQPPPGVAVQGAPGLLQVPEEPRVLPALPLAQRARLQQAEREQARGLLPGLGQ